MDLVKTTHPQMSVHMMWNYRDPVNHSGGTKMEFAIAFIVGLFKLGGYHYLLIHDGFLSEVKIQLQN